MPAAAFPLLAVALITAAGAWLRFHNIGSRSLWTDEGFTAAFARLDWFDFARALWRREANMTLYYLLMRAWTHLGDSEALLRAVSAIASVATIPAIYALGRRLFGTTVGLIAAVLFAVNAYSIRYAQEARSYGLVVFLVTLATYFFAVALEGKQRFWTAYVWASVLAIYAHFFAVLVIIAHGVTIRLLRRSAQVADADGLQSNFNRAAKWIAWITAPIWIFIAATGAGPIKWIQRPGLQDLYWFLEYFTGHGGKLLLGLFIVSAAAAIFAKYLHRSLSATPWAMSLVVAWFAVPMVIVLLFSLARPVFLPRYMMICLPALVLLAAAGIGLLRQPLLVLASVALFCYLAGTGIRVCYDVPKFAGGHEEFREAATYILDHSRSGDEIMFYSAGGRWPYAYYAAHLPSPAGSPLIVYPGKGDLVSWQDFTPKKPSPELLKTIARDCPRLWVVISNTPASEDPVTQQIKSVMGQHFRTVSNREFTAVQVYLYAND